MKYLHAFLLPLCILCSSCSPYTVKDIRPKDVVRIPRTYAFQKNASAKKSNLTEDFSREWWRSFEEESLNKLIEMAFSENLSLAAAWQRLLQARARANIAGAEQYPSLESGFNASRNRIEGGDPRFGTAEGFSNKRLYDDFAVRTGLSFEFDIWKRVASRASAADLSAEASAMDYEQTALILAGEIAELWLEAQEQFALKRLLQEQIQTSKTFLELNQLRFSVGRGNALDVLQQRQQLESLRAELPPVKLRIEQILNEISLLVAKPKKQIFPLAKGEQQPVLPDLPKVIRPADLFLSRPDLKSLLLQTQAAEYDVAAAVAERFPRLSIGLSYDFSTTDLDTLFEREFGSLSSNVLVPIIDGGRRRAQVRLSKAQAEELNLKLQETYLGALRDVENALANEYYQQQLLRRLQIQSTAARETLEQSQLRYRNGLNSYLDVIVALQTLQNLERRIVSEKNRQLIARVRLHRAMGGLGLAKQDHSQEKEVS